MKGSRVFMKDKNIYDLSPKVKLSLLSKLNKDCVFEIPYQVLTKLPEHAIITVKSTRFSERRA